MLRTLPPSVPPHTLLARGQAFMRVVQTVNVFVANDLSAQYFDSCKDRLYAGAATSTTAGADRDSTALQPSTERAVSQAVLREILRVLVRVIAPIVPFTAEDTFQHSAPVMAPTLAANASGSNAVDVPAPEFTVFDVPFHAPASLPAPEWLNSAVASDWAILSAIRAEALRLLEEARVAQHIGSALEARIVLLIPAEFSGGLARVMCAEAMKTLGTGGLGDASLPSVSATLVDCGALRAVFGVSEVVVIPQASSAEVLQPNTRIFDATQVARPAFSFKRTVLIPTETLTAASIETEGPETQSQSTEELTIVVESIAGAKCARCWRYAAEVAAHPASLCVRCDAVIDALGLWEGEKSAKPA
jgi:isoleucyl-tRNA synthetase